MAKAGVSSTTFDVIVNELNTARRLAQDIEVIIEAALTRLPDDPGLGWLATPPNITRLAVEQARALHAIVEDAQLADIANDLERANKLEIVAQRLAEADRPFAAVRHGTAVSLDDAAISKFTEAEMDAAVTAMAMRAHLATLVSRGAEVLRVFDAAMAQTSTDETGHSANRRSDESMVDACRMTADDCDQLFEIIHAARLGDLAGRIEEVNQFACLSTNLRTAQFILDEMARKPAHELSEQADTEVERAKTNIVKAAMAVRSGLETLIERTEQTLCRFDAVLRKETER